MLNSTSTAPITFTTLVYPLTLNTSQMEVVVEEDIIVREPVSVQDVETITVEVLSTGFYTIRTVPSLQLVGRNVVEDASFDPKGVFGQPLGVPLSENSTFHLRHVGRESYYITVGGDRGRVVQLEGRVAAVLHDIDLVEVDPYDVLPVAQRWAVRRQPQHGDDVYTYVPRLLGVSFH